MRTKLTLEIDYNGEWDESYAKVKHSTEADSSELSISDLCEIFCGLLKSAGFQVDNVGEVDEIR